MSAVPHLGTARVSQLLLEPLHIGRIFFLRFLLSPLLVLRRRNEGPSSFAPCHVVPSALLGPTTLHRVQHVGVPSATHLFPVRGGNRKLVCQRGVGLFEKPYRLLLVGLCRHKLRAVQSAGLQHGRQEAMIALITLSYLVHRRV